MIHYIKKDITSIDRGVIVQGVNCQGVMGSGVAGDIRAKWPKVFGEYFKFCYENEPLLGKINPVKVEEEIWVINAFTQKYYGRDGLKYADVASVEQSVRSAYAESIRLQLPIYMPKIGCGLGGLHWQKEVLPILERLSLDEFPITICEKE